MQSPLLETVSRQEETKPWAAWSWSHRQLCCPEAKPHQWMKRVRASAFISQWADQQLNTTATRFFNYLWKASSLCNSRVVYLDTSFPAPCAYFPTFYPIHLLHFSRLIRRHSRWQGHKVSLRLCIITRSSNANQYPGKPLYNSKDFAIYCTHVYQTPMGHLYTSNSTDTTEGWNFWIGHLLRVQIMSPHGA